MRHFHATFLYHLVIVTCLWNEYFNYDAVEEIVFVLENHYDELRKFHSLESPVLFASGSYREPREEAMGL